MTEHKTVTYEEALAIKAKDDALHEWMKARKTNSYHPDELPPEITPATNAERSAAEVAFFEHDKPAHYLCYIKRPDRITANDPYPNYYGASGLATTWTGQKLGNVQFGRAFRDNFGGWRIPINVYAITGESYHGFYFASAGDYARITKHKRHATTGKEQS